MTPTPATAPRDMAAAMHTLTDPTAHGCNLAVMQSNWAFLKEARGQPVHQDRLGDAAHLIAYPARAAQRRGLPVTDDLGYVRNLPCFVGPASTHRSDDLRAVNAVDAARIRARPAISAAIRALWTGERTPA